MKIHYSNRVRIYYILKPRFESERMSRRIGNLNFQFPLIFGKIPSYWAKNGGNFFFQKVVSKNKALDILIGKI